MRRAATIVSLLAGLLLFDLLLNAPGLDPRAAVVTLLRPSIDLLVVAAALLMAAQAGARGGTAASHRVARALVCLFVAGIALHTLARRLGLGSVVAVFGNGGPALAAGWALMIVGAAALILLSWLAGLLVVRGFTPGVTRSVFLLALALVAVVHVLTGNHVFAPSEIPRIVRELTGLLR
jgi:hypothetical protein